MIKPRFVPAAALATAFVWALPVAGMASDAFPSRPVRIVVPFAAGGVADALPRIIGQKLAERWSQPVVVENRPGASGNIGMELGARAAPDGYTLVLAPTGNLTVNPTLFPGLPFDTHKDLTPITVLASSPNVIESGLPGFDVTSWYGLVVRSGTPVEVVQKLHRDIADALKTDDVRAKLTDLGLEPVGNSPDAFARMIRTESEKWSDIVRKAGIKPLQ